MKTMYNQIITKLIEMDYIYFVNGEELIDAVNLIVNVYCLAEVIDEKFGKEVFKKMISSAVRNLNHVLIGSFDHDNKEKTFNEWFNETYMTQ